MKNKAMERSLPLHELKVGQHGTIVGVGGEGAIKRRMMDMGLVPGTVVTAVRVAHWVIRSSFGSRDTASACAGAKRVMSPSNYGLRKRDDATFHGFTRRICTTYQHPRWTAHSPTIGGPRFDPGDHSARGAGERMGTAHRGVQGRRQTGTRSWYGTQDRGHAAEFTSVIPVEEYAKRSSEW